MSRKLNPGKILLLLLIPLALIAAFWFASKTSGDELCRDVQISIQSQLEQTLLNEQDVYNLLEIKNKTALTGKMAGVLNPAGMEKKIMKHPTVKKVRVYLGMNGKLHIELEERTPIIRVIPEGSRGYYLTEDRVKIPLSSHYTPDLIPATGSMNDLIDTKLYAVMGFVNNNSFWKEQIEQFFVSTNGDIGFIPLTGVHEVILGDTAQLEEKFKKLEVFYRNGLSKIGWNKYKSVNLKFKGQVICK